VGLEGTNDKKKGLKIKKKGEKNIRKKKQLRGLNRFPLKEREGGKTNISDSCEDQQKKGGLCVLKSPNGSTTLGDPLWEEASSRR